MNVEASSSSPAVTLYLGNNIGDRWDEDYACQAEPQVQPYEPIIIVEVVELLRVVILLMGAAS